MFALDKDRGVEGCGAEASIRSRGLKTEAGDIPGVGGGGVDILGSARSGEKGGKH